MTIYDARSIPQAVGSGTKDAEIAAWLVTGHHLDLPHGIIQMTMHSKACLGATEEIARLLGERLSKAVA